MLLVEACDFVKVEEQMSPIVFVLKAVWRHLQKLTAKSSRLQ